jgi:hypothetical protein
MGELEQDIHFYKRTNTENQFEGDWNSFFGGRAFLLRPKNLFFSEPQY